jgi:hypothetical protein
VLSIDTKSYDCGGAGVLGFSEVGDPGSESVEDIDRRFVRTGVRVGNAGGPLDEVDTREDVVARERDGRASAASAKAPPSVSSCTLLIVV